MFLYRRGFCLNLRFILFCFLNLFSQNLLFCLSRHALPADASSLSEAAKKSGRREADRVLPYFVL